MISIRRMSLGSGYRYLMESVAVGDGAGDHRSGLTRYYAESGTPPGIFLGAGLAALDRGQGVRAGSEVSEEHLFRMLGLCADPISGEPLGRAPNRWTVTAAGSDGSLTLKRVNGGGQVILPASYASEQPGPPQCGRSPPGSGCRPTGQPPR